MLSVFLAHIASAPAYPEYIRATEEEELILISTASEVKFGSSLSKKTEKRFGLDEDFRLQSRINEIGRKIAAVCDRRDITYVFRVLKGEDLEREQKLNAFALPGGYVYIFREMVEFLDEDDQIASVLAHEVGHIAAKHSVTRLQGSLGAMLLQMLANAASSSNEARVRTNKALGLLMTSYSREDETMADRLSVRYMQEAGYDPAGALRVIEKMADLQSETPLRKFTSYRSHPYLAERIAAIRKEMRGRMDFVDFMNSPATMGEQ